VINDFKFIENSEDKIELLLNFMSEIIFGFKSEINASEWIPKWLSFFTLEKEIGTSYSSLVGAMQSEFSLLCGENNQNIPTIIKILINVYKKEHMCDHHNSEIEYIFEKIKALDNFQDLLNTAKADSDDRILEKLMKYFP
jgi:hypothetical protein